MNLLELRREYMVCIQFPAMKQNVLLFISKNCNATFINFLKNLVINFKFRINITTERTIRIHEFSLSRSVSFMPVRCVRNLHSWATAFVGSGDGRVMNSCCCELELQQWCPIGLHDKNEQPSVVLSNYWLDDIKKPYLSSILVLSFFSQFQRHTDCWFFNLFNLGYVHSEFIDNYWAYLPCSYFVSVGYTGENITCFLLWRWAFQGHRKNSVQCLYDCSKD